MVCLQNRIGIKGCGAVTNPAPQLFINDLPGVTIELFESLTNDEQQTFLEVWAKVVIRAMQKFDVLARAQFYKCFQLTDKTIIPCLICENSELFDVALWYLHGVELMIEVTSSDEMSRFTTVGLEKAERLKEEFYSEFTSSLADAVGCINLKDTECIDNGCIETKKDIMFNVQTP